MTLPRASVRQFFRALQANCVACAASNNRTVEDHWSESCNR